jgi:large subunit ribosomal protein L23
MKSQILQNNKLSVLKAPRVTEKAAMLMEKNVYTFEVLDSATSTEVKKAIESIYKVKPVKVAMVKIQKKNVFIRGRKGVKSGGKKAYVYLKKGDKIEIA